MDNGRQKYLLVGRDTGQFFGSLAIDTVDSGFPVFNELLVMANDAMQAQQHLEAEVLLEDEEYEIQENTASKNGNKLKTENQKNLPKNIKVKNGNKLKTENEDK